MPAAVFGASGGAAIYRTLAVKAVGGVDPDWFMYYEDTDLAWRLRLAGWESHYCPDAVVVHRHAATSDVHSRSFAHYTERNRLLTLARNAPVEVLVAATARHLVTTASLTVKRLRGVEVPADPVFDPALRLGVLAQAARRLPGILATRGSTSRAARRRVWTDWRGRADRPLGDQP